MFRSAEKEPSIRVAVSVMVVAAEDSVTSAGDSPTGLDARLEVFESPRT